METILPLLLLLVASGTAVQGGINLSGKVFVFPRTSSDSYVTLSPQLDKALRNLTVCLRAYSDLDRSYSLFSFATHVNSNDILLFKEEGAAMFSVSIGGEAVYYTAKETYPAPRHYCFTWESASGLVQLFLDGNPLVRKGLQKGYVVTRGVRIILGQEQDSWGGGFEEKQSFVGEIGDVFMWDSVLTLDQIRAVDSGGITNPNFLDWHAMTYEEKGYVVIAPHMWY
ncbi:serum amyloid P-component-like [Tachyglossus aculeatus]|uniref:serum amyloid P-component-like n=1 Tax=Tachyglossus aculeatus TaxID=9261 RepID=UPI0018F3CAB1|nr:serum amyloid P-component-like [Tachyglossus aculeatus]